MGSPDFSAAAQRYTECRLHPLAMELLADIDENTVDMVPNYDGKVEEPTVLPSRFPNLLVNGSQGIAVGMATNIPPHNLGEAIDAVVHLIDNPDATPDDLMQFVKGPDFPTGGSILGRAGIIDAYRTGRGSVKLRATAEIEESKKGAMQIVVSELPYQTSCSSIAARIQELVDSGQLDGIADVNDASAEGKTELVITLKRDGNANVVLNNLFKLTQLQSSFAINMVALVNGVPRTLNLVAAAAGLRRPPGRGRHPSLRVPPRQGDATGAHPRRADQGPRRHRRDHRPDPRQRRRHAPPRTGLMAEPFGFSEIQAIDILDMQLRRLTRLSRIDIETELEETREAIRELEAILADPVAAPQRHQVRAGDDPREVRHASRLSDRPRLRRDVDRGPRRRQGARRRDDRGAVRQGGPGRAVQDPVARWPRRRRRQAQGRRPRPPRHLHHGARPPAVLLQLRQGVPPAGARHPRARAHRQGHADRQPAAAAAGRDDPGDHRHPRLRRRALPVLRHPPGDGEEDGVRRLRLEPPRRPDRHQPARRRRTRACHRDQRRRRHLHGHPSGHDDPLQRGRGAPDGPHGRRRPRHAGAAPATKSCPSTSPATTRRS